MLTGRWRNCRQKKPEQLKRQDVVARCPEWEIIRSSSSWSEARVRNADGVRQLRETTFLVGTQCATNTPLADSFPRRLRPRVSFVLTLTAMGDLHMYVCRRLIVGKV